MSNADLILGVDPGYSGALAWYDCRNHRLVHVTPMPLKPETGSAAELFGAAKPASGGGRSVVDGDELAREIRASGPLRAVVMEHVASSPKMGVTSAFRFGQGFGVLQGVLAALGHTPRLVYPNVWKTSLNLSSDKSKSTAAAITLFPEWSDTFRRGAKSADLAEAALIAYYGRVFVAK